MIRALAILAVLGLCGCITSQEQEIASDDTLCRSYGAQPGTQPYIACRMQQDQVRQQRQTAAINNMTRNNNAALEPMEAYLARRRPTTCNSTVMGSQVTTSCD